MQPKIDKLQHLGQPKSYMQILYLLFAQKRSISFVESFSISCRILESSYCINWIHQPTGKALEWLGYLCNGGGTNIKNKISFTQDTSKNTVFLWGNNFQTEDTAVYYCTRETQSLNKPHSKK
uniref:Ig-like domain-containing protein n=1 Tax=Cyprinus carpio TaxID=7962 RepID=A0A8C1JSE8_CYPCA